MTGARQNATLVEALGSSLYHGGSALEDIPSLLRQVLQSEAWRDFVTQRGDVVHHDTWLSFVSTPMLHGLGSSIELVDRVAGHDPEMLALLKRAKSGRAGRPRVGEMRGESPRIQDDAEDDAARLQRDRPDLLAAVAAGDRSLHAAAVEAGYRKRRISVRIDSAGSAAASLRRSMPLEQRLELARLLLEP